MMKRPIRSGYGITLFELIIAIVFFAFFATIFLRIFLSAREISNESSQLSHAIVAAQNAAENFKANKAPIQFYTKNWEPTEEIDAAYKLISRVSSQDGVKTTQILVKAQNGCEIFSLTVKTWEETSP